jgi:hypothetical protein
LRTPKLKYVTPLECTGENIQGDPPVLYAVGYTHASNVAVIPVAEPVHRKFDAVVPAVKY